MIERKYQQRQLGEGFIHDSIDGCWEPWMKVADEILDDDEIIANLVYRVFTRVGAEKVPDPKTLARIERALGPEVFQQVQSRIVGIAREKKAVEAGKMRLDTTVTETNIHYPNDS